MWKNILFGFELRGRLVVVDIIWQPVVSYVLFVFVFIFILLRFSKLLMVPVSWDVESSLADLVVRNLCGLVITCLIHSLLLHFWDHFMALAGRVMQYCRGLTNGRVRHWRTEVFAAASSQCIKMHWWSQRHRQLGRSHLVLHRTFIHCR